MSVRLIDPALAGPCLFWYWNATPTRAQIDQQVAEMAAAGFQGFYVHPMPDTFRQAEFGGGMELAYLSPAFFDLIRHTCDVAKRHGLTLWLYDEGGWPSGRACGAVVEEDLAYGIWLLENRDGDIRPVQMTDGCTYPDLMNPAATQCFIRLTHERYKAAVGNEFGRTVRGMFTDEARLLGRVGTSQVPWTPRFPAEFEADHGYCLDPVKAHLFQTATPDSIERGTQRDYLATMGRLIAENYYAPIQQWCAANALLFEGHHSGEDDFARHGQYFGDYLRQARHYDIPGVDTIWRQVHPGKPGGNFVQLASSAAWRRGSRVALSESFGVYGPGLTLDQMRWTTAFQAVRGISKTGVMAYHLSNAGAKWLGICSETSGRTPIWSNIDLWTAFMRNVAAFVCKGDPVLRVGVYYRTELTRPDDEAAFNRAHEAVCDQLGEQLLGWAFLGLDDLAKADAAGGTLRAGRINVAAIVVHVDGPIQLTEAQVFGRLAQAGVRVLIIGPRQSQLAGVEWIAALDELNLSSLRTVELDRLPRDVRMLELREGDWQGYLFFNQSDAPQEFRFTPVGGRRRFVPRDLEALGSVPPRVEATSGEGTIVRLAPGELRAYETSDKAVIDASMAGSLSQLAASTSNWRVQVVDSYSVTDGIVPSLVSNDAWPCELGDLSTAMPTFSGTVAYTATLTIQSTLDGSPLWLDLGDVRYAAALFINGKLVGRRAWAPYIFDVTAAVKAGDNALEVRVTGTLAAAWIEAVKKMDPAWRNMYVEKVEQWAGETRSLGLIGPVTLLGHATRGNDE